jgi:signal transduction histidine kinase/CheY-like chemotaxis protein
VGDLRQAWPLLAALAALAAASLRLWGSGGRNKVRPPLDLGVGLLTAGLLAAAATAHPFSPLSEGITLTGPAFLTLAAFAMAAGALAEWFPHRRRRIPQGASAPAAALLAGLLLWGVGCPPFLVACAALAMGGLAAVASLGLPSDGETMRVGMKERVGVALACGTGLLSLGSCEAEGWIRILLGLASAAGFLVLLGNAIAEARRTPTAHAWLVISMLVPAFSVAVSPLVIQAVNRQGVETAARAQLGEYEGVVEAGAKRALGVLERRIDERSRAPEVLERIARGDVPVPEGTPAPPELDLDGFDGLVALQEDGKFLFAAGTEAQRQKPAPDLLYAVEQQALGTERTLASGYVWDENRLLAIAARRLERKGGRPLALIGLSVIDEANFVASLGLPETLRPLLVLRRPVGAVARVVAERPVKGVAWVELPGLPGSTTEQSGALRLFARLPALDGFGGRAVVAGALVLVLGLLTGLVAAVVLSRRFVKPLERLDAAIAQAGATGFWSPPGIFALTEIATLAGDFGRWHSLHESSEQRLRGERALLRAVIDAVPAGILLLSEDWRPALYNRQYEDILKTSGVGPHAWNRPLTDADVRQSMSAFEDGVGAATRFLRWLETRTSGEDEILRPTDQRTFRRQCTFVAGHGWIVVVRDVTEEVRSAKAAQASAEEARNAKDEADRANDAKSAFLANMSHELRTPMNGVLGMLQLALEGERLPAETREQLDLAYTSAVGLLCLLNDILDLSKIEAGRLELEEIPFRLADVLHQVRVPALPLVRKKKLDLSLEVDETLPEALKGDPTRLRQVLTNLVGNAVKFTEKGGVTIRVIRGDLEAPEGKVAIAFEVEDTGIGIPKDRMDRLFRKFTQVDASTTRRFGGTGLGLAITQQLVSLMGGTIDATSREGKGTCFRVEVVLAVVESDAVRTTPGMEVIVVTAEAKHRAPCVLVVEDNPVNRRVAKAMLERLGVNVIEAENGQAALEALEHPPIPDVVLMDCQMPVLDGYEATKRLRADPRWVELPIVALTAAAMPDERDKCLAAGMSDFLSKPILKPALAEILKKWIAAGRASAAARGIPTTAR